MQTQPQIICGNKGKIEFMFKIVWDRENNGVLLTMKSTEEV